MQLKYSNYVAFSHFHGKAVNNSGLFLLFLFFAFCPGDFLRLGRKKTVKGRRPSPDNPWARCWTEILSCGVAFEKFSWCFRSGSCRMNRVQICA